MSQPRSIPLDCRIAGLLARRPLQPMWRLLHKIAFRGLGYHNWVSSLNGEDRFARRWAEKHKLCAIPAVIFDVGANEGDFTANLLGTLSAGSRVFLFEPNPKTFLRLQRRFAGCAEIVLENAGVGAEPGILDLYDLRGGDGTTRASFIPEVITELMGRTAESSPARVVTLDEFCCEHVIPCVDFLKIDTEGFEKMVLAGAKGLISEHRVGVIQLEMNEHAVFNGFSLYELHRTLPGFEISRLLSRYREPLIEPGRPYSPRYDFFRHCNLLCIDPDYDPQACMRMRT
jgi:FkbM family methyltransferase